MIRCTSQAGREKKSFSIRAAEASSAITSRRASAVSVSAMTHFDAARQFAWREPASRAPSTDDSRPQILSKCRFDARLGRFHAPARRHDMKSTETFQVSKIIDDLRDDREIIVQVSNLPDDPAHSAHLRGERTRDIAQCQFAARHAGPMRQPLGLADSSPCIRLIHHLAFRHAQPRGAERRGGVGAQLRLDLGQQRERDSDRRIPREECKRIPVSGPDRPLAAARIVPIENIIVQQAGIVQQLDRRRDSSMGGRDFATECLEPEEKQATRKQSIPVRGRRTWPACLDPADVHRTSSHVVQHRRDVGFECPQ